MGAVTWVKEALDQSQVPYREIHHVYRGAFTAQEVAEREHVSGKQVAKVVIVMADGVPVELIMPANRYAVLSRVREILGAREVRLATEPEVQCNFTDCDIGAIPPLRHWKGVEVLMDPFMNLSNKVLFQAGTHYDGVEMRSEDWVRLVSPRVESFTSAERTPSADSSYRE